jgi:hypothetical protein
VQSSSLSADTNDTTDDDDGGGCECPSSAALERPVAVHLSFGRPPVSSWSIRTTMVVVAVMFVLVP